MNKMKNIHILPTENSSRLSIDDGVFNLHRQQWRKCGQNIYITNDEEIRAGDWVYGLFSGSGVFKIKFDILKNSQDYKEYALKIILTTDQDLIKDGVQAIEEDFLKWFVKNPSCEFVNIKLFKKFEGENEVEPIYKIIIPKEDPKQRLEKYSERFDNKNNEIIKGIFNPDTWGKRLVNDELKQETLEEAAEAYHLSSKNAFSDSQSFTDGAKWQQERSYSDEDMREAFKYGSMWDMTFFEDWFEQFKNK